MDSPSATTLDYTADDLDPSYGPTGTNPSGVALTTEDKDTKWLLFLQAIEEGKSWRKSLKAAGLAWGTVSRWLAVDQANKAQQYAAARENGAHLWADRAVSAAHAQVETQVEATMQRLKVDVAKWRAAVQSPRRWSDRQQDTTVNVNLSLNSVHLSMLRHREPVNSGLVEVERTSGAHQSLSLNDQPLSLDEQAKP